MSDVIPRYFTNSELGAMRRCPRKWYLSEYRKLYRPHEVVNDTTYTGTLVHFGLEDMYNSGGQQDPRSSVTLMAANDRTVQEEMLAATENDSIRSILEQNIATIAKCEELALIMVQGYVEWLAEEGEDSFLEFISAEQEIAVPFPAEGMPKPGAHLLAKLDARVRDIRSNALVFMDHKSVQNFADREKWAHLDPQFLFYSLIEYLYNLDSGAEWTDGGILNMLRRVKRSARAKPPFYKRVIVRHSVLELQNYFVRVAGEIARIQQAELSLDQGVDHKMICPPSPTRDCVWDCQFFQACGIMDDGSDIEMYMEATFEIGDPLRRYETVSRS